MEQRTAEWFAARAGKITASRFKDVLGKLKTGAPSEKRNTYMWEVVLERITKSAAEHFAGTAAQWGEDQEQGGIMAYEAATGAMVEKVGFIVHPDHPNVGGSPDGRIGSEGGVEVKCPFNSIYHLQTIVGGMPPEHMPQVQGLMWVTGATWWDFVSADPRLPEPYNLYVERVERDEVFIETLEIEVVAFERDIVRTLARLGIGEAPPPDLTITDEVQALLQIDKAKDDGAAAAVLELCNKQPWYPRAVAAYKERFQQQQ